MAYCKQQVVNSTQKSTFGQTLNYKFDAKGNPSHHPSQLQDPKLYLTKWDGSKKELHSMPSNEGI